MKSLTFLPLHDGRAPRWLFSRMVKLSSAISNVILDEFGPDELAERLSNSNWFQALSCAIGYDWHSSGTTTVTVAALKEALNQSNEIYIAGGKGKAGIKTPEDIVIGVDKLSIPNYADTFIENSRLSAKVDSSLIADNFSLYHHAFIFTKNKNWTVIQQGMYKDYAVRFQWFSKFLDQKDIINEPHSGVFSKFSDLNENIKSLDLTAAENKWVRNSSTNIIEEYKKILDNFDFISDYPKRHKLLFNIDLSKRAQKIIENAFEIDPKEFKDLILLKGVGRSTIRSLAFVASLIYNKELSYRNPFIYAYNVGGKDKIPFEINKSKYDNLIEVMENIIDKSNLSSEEKYYTLKRLNNYISKNKS
ncbi:MAG: DUF763 domain-containing protein [Candidatus Micrarchaeia archaeon]